ncbi:Glyoxalase/bleomycin resistance protein/dioxygenase [Mesorhizobium prunaredense]|uniref:Glyoxalase/bleomycin resistance protein/dioxygenase n=1 Tax=Mesorhizobium prunaredense TaxID=1631249 RepID=A0A1R3V3M9_9HYPH|nr:VOC family protein [Mesorhizobium prunaredense]SIT54501.1 Glyoxalase/bleomycin resistance protein/dioxygenase [Mesorhizobium prunaredense]
MNDVQERGEAAIATRSARRVDIKLEVVVIPVSDVDRAKRFYGGLGWRLDADITGDEFRVIQFTPPGSPCSIVFGSGVTPGPYARVELDVLESVGELVVSDIEAARAELADRGVDVSEVYHYAGREGRVSGPDPERRSYSSWASFSDPSGNVWLLQEVTARAPGRVDADDTTFVSSAEFAAALRRASAAHGEHEKRTGGQRDENWPDWYAEYMVAEQAGKPLPL